MNQKCQDGIKAAVKECFLTHSLSWFSPQNLGLSVLSDDNDLSKESVGLVRTKINRRERHSYHVAAT